MAEAKVTLQAFDLDKALSGAQLAVSTDGTVDGGVLYYAYYFRGEGLFYKAEVNGGTVAFGSDGVSRGNDEGSYRLFVVKDDIVETTDGGVGTRVDGDTVSISELSPRDTIAMHIFEALIVRADRPLALSDAMIKRFAEVSYRMAAEMINKAADYRSVVSGE